MRKFLFIAVAAMLLLAACGGGGGGSKLSKKDQQEFTDLSAKAKTAKFRVTYATQDENGATSDEWTLSQESDTKKAYIQKDSKTVIDGDKAYTCDNLATTPSCEEVPGGPDGAAVAIAGFAGLYTQYLSALTTDTGAAGFSDKTTEKIAGRDAECLKWSIGGAAGGIAGKLLNGSGIGQIGWETCIDKETGVALRVKYTGGGKTANVFIATAFGDPTDADFATPTTTTIPDDTSGSTDTTEPSTDTTEPSTDTTTGDTTDTTVCTPYTLPGGVTLPSGVTLPCVPAP